LDQLKDELNQYAKEKATLDKTQTKLADELKCELKNETNTLNSAQALNKKLSGQIDDLRGNLDHEQNNIQGLDKAMEAPTTN